MSSHRAEIADLHPIRLHLNGVGSAGRFQPLFECSCETCFGVEFVRDEIAKGRPIAPDLLHDAAVVGKADRPGDGAVESLLAFAKSARRPNAGPLRRRLPIEVVVRTPMSRTRAG